MNRTRLIAAILALALAFGARNADAHSRKEATEPPDGAVIDAMTKVISIRFDMPLRVTLITLTDQKGAEHVLTRSTTCSLLVTSARSRRNCLRNNIKSQFPGHDQSERQEWAGSGR